MTLRNLAFTLAAASLAAGPIAAQAAPARAPAPMADEAEGLAGSGPLIPLLGFAIISALFVILWDDGDDSPTSP